jgi:hypothetical protein
VRERLFIGTQLSNLGRRRKRKKRRSRRRRRRKRRPAI